MYLVDQRMSGCRTGPITDQEIEGAKAMIRAREPVAQGYDMEDLAYPRGEPYRGAARKLTASVITDFSKSPGLADIPAQSMPGPLRQEIDAGISGYPWAGIRSELCHDDGRPCILPRP